MKTRTLLVDSSYLLKRSVNGAKNVNTNKFGHIGGLYSFLTKLRMLIKQHSINKVILVWDGDQNGYYRYLIDPAYKGNRKNKNWHGKIKLTEREIQLEEQKEQSILKQRKRIQAYAEELFLRQIEVDKIEADDLIASYCELNNKKEDIFLYSNDRDFIQLLKYDITILFGTLGKNKDVPITTKNFFFEFEYTWKNSLSMKIIEGDTADHIKGINGIKVDTLLKHFPDLKVKPMSVKEICDLAYELNSDRVKKKMKPLVVLERLLSEDGIERLKKNYKLMNLSKPMLNAEAIDELDQLDMPLSSHDRNSKNLLKMMTEDDYLIVWGGSFSSYVEPFFSVIMNEKKILKDFKRKGKLLT
jgi:5'-3' exonuclease